jgi:hypothetical protein
MTDKTTTITESVRLRASRAVDEADLSLAGLNYLLGYLVSEMPETALRGLAVMEQKANTDPAWRARYFEAPGDKHQ